jgi:hypothetical protein
MQGMLEQRLIQGPVRLLMLYRFTVLRWGLQRTCVFSHRPALGTDYIILFYFLFRMYYDYSR